MLAGLRAAPPRLAARIEHKAPVAREA